MPANLKGSDEKVMAREANRPDRKRGVLMSLNILPLRPTINPDMTTFGLSGCWGL